MCKITAAAIASDGQAVATALLAIATATEATNPTLAANLSTAAATLVKATTGWKTGDAVDDINTAATVIESILAAIPLTAPYASFVAIAVAALDILIGNLGTQSAQTPNVVANAQLIQAHVDALPENPYRGLVTVRPSIFGVRHSFTSKWNGQVDAQPELGFPKI